MGGSAAETRNRGGTLGTLADGDVGGGGMEGEVGESAKLSPVLRRESNSRLCFGGGL